MQVFVLYGLHFSSPGTISSLSTQDNWRGINVTTKVGKIIIHLGYSEDLGA